MATDESQGKNKINDTNCKKHNFSGKTFSTIKSGGDMRDAKQNIKLEFMVNIKIADYLCWSHKMLPGLLIQMLRRVKVFIQNRFVIFHRENQPALDKWEHKGR
ncbi:CLUMA_CG019662, isoform A [Clunio marinus]|uniref:CLUMA_CG019662, isoform A n=1 Tax=Clunio marinus TaxID=568069 RepID=A0A1J1J2B2_9DIPT|nr:CLUMA_CG019662, isoform A [Clunio marinus]